MVLPGLKPVTSKFVDSVAKRKAASTVPTKAPMSRKKNNKTKRSNEKFSPPSMTPPMETVVVTYSIFDDTYGNSSCNLVHLR